MKNLILLSIVFFGLYGCSSIKQQDETDHTQQHPNIVFIYLDDLGYGDVGAYGAQALETPNIDNLAHNGLRFTDGYSSSATCTPSRYALLTGAYPWRNKNAKILPGTAPLIIGANQMTVPKMLKKAGYQTGIVGKWHLGLGDGNVNWNKKITFGPNEVGFDYSYIMAATQDRVPTVYIENGNVVGLDPNDPIEINYKQNFEGEPTAISHPELTTMKWHHGHNNSIVNGIPRIGFMKGGTSAKWSDIDMADHFLEKAQTYVKEHKEKPFFLYYAMQQPHVPRTPNPRFVGKSGLGPRGDVIVEADWMIGEFMKTLEEEGVLDNTLIVFSSDNGPVLNDGYYDDAEEKLGIHTPTAGLRGGKYSLFEAGTRVPFITYWKGKITPNVSNALVCQMDLLPSLAELVGVEVGTNDAQNLMSTFLGKSNVGRDELILEATSRTTFRQGDWILIPPYKGPASLKKVNIEIGNAADFQLYNLKEDVKQQRNLAEENKEKLQQMLHDFVVLRGGDYSKTETYKLR
ncbi:sulfatase family protein [Flammeovirga kamogawensis]|uniref:Arylsulfatase n=1 Tax=Flammeovirga kamogawensis TaxID=373891 RepID=A0ABX8H4V8_9BACT|nr:arylsulfatase [Flammeovirga kamogawensis]MBB6461702.1 arylsulfatase A-like enzyme [Flammeovirga kamogawensis]QWG10622.1 arylsulfatase [Flammeovirga kamogawensis]TRX63727.1 arylsulfatase [Flammeovirga kamogawensis]